MTDAFVYGTPPSLENPTAPPCSSHGNRNEATNKCECDNPVPPTYTTGYTGDRCEIKVQRGLADGEMQMKGSLGEDQMECWVVETAWDGPWEYLAVHLERTSPEGDPDLYGLFSKFDDVRVPHSNARGFSFSETSSSEHTKVTQTVQKADYILKGEAYDFAYLCVYAWGQPVAYNLTAFLSLCPPSFSGAGKPEICATRVHKDHQQGIWAPDTLSIDEGYRGVCSVTNGEKSCHCGTSDTPQFRPPPIWSDPKKTASGEAQPEEEVYPGLGFEDCSAEWKAMDPGPLPNGKSWEGETVPVGVWRFYRFEVPEDSYEVRVTLETVPASDNGTAAATLYLKRGAPPGSRWSQYDERANNHYGWGSSADTTQEVSLKRKDSSSGFRTGFWYAGVKGGGNEATTYSLEVHVFSCPGGCSGRGDCVSGLNGTRSCVCFKGYFGEDCSAESKRIEFGDKQTLKMDNREYEYFTLPHIDDASAKSHVELEVAVSYTSKNAMRPWLAKPELYLLDGGKGGYPSEDEYTYRKVLEKPGEAYSIDVCARQLNTGSWRVAIHNPSRMSGLEFIAEAKRHVFCPNDCSNSQHCKDTGNLCNGRCQDNGVCKCSGTYDGADCSVDTGTIGACLPNSYRRSPLMVNGKISEGGGDCLQMCQCIGGGCGWSEGKCELVACPIGSRRHDGTDMCVRDECYQDEVVEDVANGAYKCEKRCECPPGGGPCKLATSCSKQTFVCVAPWQRLSNGNMGCFLPGCEEGSVMEHDGCLRECTCGAEEATKTRCSRHESACLTGAPAAGAAGGGKGKAGDTPGWAMFLLCLVMLGVGAAGAIFGPPEYQKRFGRKGVQFHDSGMEMGNI